MGIRDSFNKRPALGITLGVAALALAGLLAWRAGAGAGGVAHYRAFYSDDDGKTWFTDDFTRFPPFDHIGKMAYRAQVFRAGAGHPFVGYLECYPPDVQARLTAACTSTNAMLIAVQSASDSVLVKKPGGATWISPTSRAYQEIVTPKSPDGSTGDLVQMSPGQ